MFNAKQKRLMNTLGIVTEADREIMYEGYCEVACEMAANGMNAGTFGTWLEHKVRVAEMVAERNAKKAIKTLA